MPKKLPNPPYRISQIDFFDNEPCWDWLGAVRGGYGIVTIGELGFKTSAQASRIIYKNITGIDISSIKQLDHKCRRRICVNPKHLEIVSNQVNCQRENLAKLTEDQVKEIRELAKKGMRQIDIAKQFNISQPTVSAIKIGKYWGNI